MITEYPISGDSVLLGFGGNGEIYFEPNATGPREIAINSKFVPNLSERLTMFIAGPPGAGKSTMASKMISYFNAEKNMPIYLFTGLSEKDDSLEELGKIRHIKMEPKVIKDLSLQKIRHASMGPSLLLFDDIDKISNPKLNKLIFDIADDALANGRAHDIKKGENISVVITAHHANDYRKTKYPFENSEYVIIFPLYAPINQTKLILDKIGLNKEQQEEIRSNCKRECIIHKEYPLYVITDNKIILI